MVSHLRALRVLNPGLAEAILWARPRSSGGCRKTGRRRGLADVPAEWHGSVRRLTDRILAEQQACCAECASGDCSEASERAAPVDPVVPVGIAGFSLPTRAVPFPGTHEKKKGKNKTKTKNDDAEEEANDHTGYSDGTEDAGDGEGGDDADDGDAGDDGDSGGSSGDTTSANHSWCEAASNDQQTCHWFDGDGCICTDNSTYYTGSGPRGSSGVDCGPDIGDPTDVVPWGWGGGEHLESGPDDEPTLETDPVLRPPPLGPLTLAEVLFILGLAGLDIDDSPDAGTSTTGTDDGLDLDPDSDDATSADDPDLGDEPTIDGDSLEPCTEGIVLFMMTCQRDDGSTGLTKTYTTPQPCIPWDECVEMIH